MKMRKIEIYQKGDTLKLVLLILSIFSAHKSLAKECPKFELGNHFTISPVVAENELRTERGMFIGYGNLYQTISDDTGVRAQIVYFESNFRSGEVSLLEHQNAIKSRGYSFRVYDNSRNFLFSVHETDSSDDNLLYKGEYFYLLKDCNGLDLETFVVREKSVEYKGQDALEAYKKTVNIYNEKLGNLNLEPQGDWNKYKIGSPKNIRESSITNGLGEVLAKLKYDIFTNPSYSELSPVIEVMPKSELMSPIMKLVILIKFYHHGIIPPGLDGGGDG